MADNLLVDQPNGQWKTLAATDSGGVLTLATSTAVPNDVLLVQQPNGQWAKLALYDDGTGVCKLVTTT